MSHEEGHKIAQFNQALDAMITGEHSEEGDWADSEERDMLEIARMLHQADWSTESTRLGEIRQQMMAQATGETGFDRMQGENTMLHLNNSHHTPLKTLALSAAALALIVAAVWIVPPLRNIAQEIFDDWFPKAESDQKTIEHDEFSDEDTITVETLAEIEDEIPFIVITPDFSDSELVETIAGYSPSRNAVWHRYMTETRIIIIQQQPIADAEASGLFTFVSNPEIGPESVIETVQIGESFIGKIVTGNWINRSPDTNQTYQWAEDFPAVTLRWQDDTYVYEIRMLPSVWEERRTREYQAEIREDAIALANELMD